MLTQLNFSLIFSIGTIVVLAITLVILLYFIILYYLKRPEALGKQGENKVKRVIGKTVENKQYVINNLILQNSEMTCQIDHVVINPRGIFVIETKNYSGKIYGSVNQREWTQILAYGRMKNKIYNPLKQNATHVYNVRQVVGKLPTRSLVVFVQNNSGHIDSDNVIPLFSLKRILQQGENVLTTHQMKTAYEALLASAKDVSTKIHVSNIKTQQNNIEKGLCPRCGSELVLRKGKHGNFYGCSKYPKCKFTKQI